MASQEQALPRRVANLWVTSSLGLREFARRLAAALGLPPFSGGDENVWEWQLVRLENGLLEVNLSRRHNAGTARASDYSIGAILIVAAEAPPEWDEAWARRTWVEKLGRAMASVAGETAYHGHVRYLGDEEFTYEPQSEFFEEGRSA
jgi:hypothetical protein